MSYEQTPRDKMTEMVRSKEHERRRREDPKYDLADQELEGAAMDWAIRHPEDKHSKKIIAKAIDIHPGLILNDPSYREFSYDVADEEARQAKEGTSQFRPMGYPSAGMRLDPSDEDAIERLQFEREHRTGSVRPRMVPLEDNAGSKPPEPPPPIDEEEQIRRLAARGK